MDLDDQEKSALFLRNKIFTLTGNSDFFLLGSNNLNRGHESVGNDGNAHEKINEDQNVGESASGFFTGGKETIIVDSLSLDDFENSFLPVTFVFALGGFTTVSLENLGLI